jgi:hypothetical protein
VREGTPCRYTVTILFHFPVFLKKETTEIVVAEIKGTVFDRIPIFMSEPKTPFYTVKYKSYLLASVSLDYCLNSVKQSL